MRSIDGLLGASCLALVGSLALRAQPALRDSPEFAIQFPDGSRQLLSQYRGKVVSLEFLSTTCPHCQHASQLMDRLQKEYGPRGFQALGVAFNPMAHMLVPDFTKAYATAHPIGFSPPELVHEYLQVPLAFRLMVPQLVWIDRKGKIRAQTPATGESDMYEEKNIRAMLETLLKEPAATAVKKAAPAKKKTS